MNNFVIGVARLGLSAGEHQCLIHVENKHFLVLPCISLDMFGHQKEFLLRNGLEQEILDLN